MRTQDINRLIYNPIWISMLLHYFLSGVTDSNYKKLKFELIYLALPFLFEEKLMKKLSLSSKRSTFSTLLKKSPLFTEAELKNCLINMDNKIELFKEMTNKALVVLGSKIAITDGCYIYTSDSVNYQKFEGDFRDHFKAAYNLGLILSKEHHREILLKIGSNS